MSAPTPASVADWLALPSEQFTAELDRARLCGDGATAEVDADDLMRQVLTGRLEETGEGDSKVQYGRLGYNVLLDVADHLTDDPELALTSKSRVSRYLAEVPEVARHFFDPIPAPDWIDAEQLRIAQNLWEQNIIPLLLVLYSSSLPACYLIRKGIPALYDTGKLAKAKYVGQRLFETALMLDEVMSVGGITVVLDSEDPPQEMLAAVLQRIAPGAWALSGTTASIDRTHSCLNEMSFEQFYDKFEDEFEMERRRRERARFLWGRGYLSARKVRALHSSMRHMLQHPESTAGAGAPAGWTAQGGSGGGGCPFSAGDEPPGRFWDELRRRKQRGIHWNAKELGVPINQEDQAFTLLTFGYLLPRGLQHWGGRVSTEQRNAFLHLWKVVGYIMGVRTDFTTDRWDEAEALYTVLLKRQAGGGDPGRVLTETVMEFTGQYLPKSLGLSSWLPAKMIVDQISIDQERLDRDPSVTEKVNLAACILGPKPLEECSRTGPRMIYWILRRIVEVQFFVRNEWLLHVPIVGGIVRAMFHEPGRELYESFRGEYSRRPFYIPQDATDWTLERGITPEFSERVQRWRRRLFTRIGLGLGCLVASTLAGLIFFGAVVTNAASLAMPRYSEKLFKEAEDLFRVANDALSSGLVAWLVVSGLLTLLLFFGGMWTLKVVVPRFFKKRPRLHPGYQDTDPHRK